MEMNIDNGPLGILGSGRRQSTTEADARELCQLSKAIKWQFSYFVSSLYDY